MRKLSTTNHDRDSAALRYVYPVVSRRAGGVSVGINLNPNNACNFRCVYCQVPGLQFGKGPPIELGVLESELRGLLGELLHGSFMMDHVPEGARRLSDIAFSGNGEPTSSAEFGHAVDLVGRVMAEFGLLGKVDVVLITNGTLTHQAPVAEAIGRMRELGGQVWFKLDSATAAGAEAINGSRASVQERLARLDRVSRLCPTWVQTCMFRWHGNGPTPSEVEAYVEALGELVRGGAPLRGVLLYSLARPSMQPEGADLAPLEPEPLEAIALRVRALGLTVRVTP